MSSSLRPSLRHVPALDGVRGLAVAGVLLFHGGFSWAAGGYLGVSAFFTLSGYLITSLLLLEHEATGRISLRSFWVRRFRRLLPAAVVVLAGVAAVAAVAADSGQLANLRGDMLAALANVANWRFVLDDRSYAELFTGPSPLHHYWSLAIEEQFYLAFPLLVAGVLRLSRGRRTPLAAVLVVLAGASTLWSLHLASSAAGLEQAYYDTGARAVELLAGALLAVVLVGRLPVLERHRRPVAAAGSAAGVALAASWMVLPQDWSGLHRGGLVLHAVLVLVVLAAAHVPGPVSSVASGRLLQRAGRVSYGLYLIHWPVFVWLDSARTGLDALPLFGLRMAVTVALTAASYAIVEQPIRTSRILAGSRAALAGVAGAAAVVALAITVPSTARPADDILLALDGLRAADTAPPASVVDAAAQPTTSGPDPDPTARPAAPRPAESGAAATGTAATAGGGATTAAVQARGEIDNVLLVGDSVMSQALPALEPRFAARGVRVSYAGGPGTGPLFPQGSWAQQVDSWVAAEDPDVVVIEACCNYTFEPDVRYVDASGAQVVPGTPAVLTAWDREMRDLVRRAGTRGAQVLLVRFPPVSTNGWYGPIEEHVTAVNALYERMVADDPSIGLIDWSAVLAPAGDYESAIPFGRGGSTVPVRLDDGVHLTDAGSELVADATVTTVLDRS